MQQNKRDRYFVWLLRYHRFLKWVWHPLKLLASFRVYNKTSHKVAVQVVLWKILNNFIIMFTLYKFYNTETTRKIIADL